MEWIDDIKEEFCNELKQKGFSNPQIKDILAVCSNYVGRVGGGGFQDDIMELDYFIKILQE